MEGLTTLLGLVSKTQGRDKVLRLFQFSCLHALSHPEKGARFRVYEQMRMTRKLLRFLKTLDYSFKVKAQLHHLWKTNGLEFMRHLFSMLQNVFGFLYFLWDHQVCLSQLNVLPIDTARNCYPKSMLFYFMQNFMGIFNDLICIVISLVQSKDNRDLKKLMRAIRHYSFDLIRCFLDCLVAMHFGKGIFSHKVTGVIGVVSSLMAIMQNLQKM